MAKGSDVRHGRRVSRPWRSIRGGLGAPPRSGPSRRHPRAGSMTHPSPTEGDKAARVRQMFARIAPRYDLMNRS